MGMGIPWDSHGNGNCNLISMGMGMGMGAMPDGSGNGYTLRGPTKFPYSSERVFSTAGRLLDKRCSILSSNNVNDLLFLHSNM